ncbi:MAG: preprotein translocase subunit SecA [Actinomycetota bacterium]
MGWLGRLLGVSRRKELKALSTLVPAVNALDAELEALSDRELRGRSAELRTRVARGAPLDEVVVEAFALVRCASFRVVGLRHHDGQLLTGGSIHLGWVADMRPGEGKTLALALPSYLHALPGRGVHVVAGDDAGAAAQAARMGAIHRFLGLDVGLIRSGASDAAGKRRQYAADITFGAAKELGFDYLRDNMATSAQARVQRDRATCIIDEIDSVLIDGETSLKIMGKPSESGTIPTRLAALVEDLTPEEHYDVDRQDGRVLLRDVGLRRVERELGVDDIFALEHSLLRSDLELALRAKELHRRDVDYVVRYGAIYAVDPSTGLPEQGRRLPEGIHEAVEAREGLGSTKQTLAMITQRSYFRSYRSLSGVSSTARAAAGELASAYGLEVLTIPRSWVSTRVDAHDLIFATSSGRDAAVVDDVAARQTAGQPVLIGTRSDHETWRLSRALRSNGVPHAVLETKTTPGQRAAVVGRAGRLGAVTVSSSAAARGVDIVLGGDPEQLARADALSEGVDPDSEPGRKRCAALFDDRTWTARTEREQVIAMGGLHVIGIDRHGSRRADDALRGRSGRRGEPGESRFYLSVEDQLLRMMAANTFGRVWSTRIEDDLPVSTKRIATAIRRTQASYERLGATLRDEERRYSDVLDAQTERTYARRDGLLEGASIRREAHRHLAEAIRSSIRTFCPSEHRDGWDVDGLAAEVRGYWPTELDAPGLRRGAESRQTLEDLLLADGTAAYERRADELGGTKDKVIGQVERTVMLRVIDQQWREHLEELQYLRERLREQPRGLEAPLVRWRREADDRFRQLQVDIARDFLRYVIRVEVIRKGPPALAPTGTTADPPSVGAADA